MKKINSENPCIGCIGVDGNECCIDVYVVLNANENYLFEGKEHFKEFNKGGGIFFTDEGCPYFDKKEKNCVIHDKKPIYCKYYPIFITGKTFVDPECPASNKYEITDKIKKEIALLQKKYPIYREEWRWKDVQKFFNLNMNE